MPLETVAQGGGPGLPGREWVDALRREIPALQHWIYMNTGTSGPSPKAVTEAQIEWVRRLERDGGGSLAFREPFDALLSGAREAWARILGAGSAAHVALTHNTSEGIAMVAAALEWQPGDEVVVSELEHISGLLPWAYLQRRRGVVVRHLPARDGNLAVEDVEAAMTGRTRLLCFSHVSYSTGAILPVRDLVELAAARGVPTLIDGAQSVGQLPLDVAGLGCDFYAVPGQKWLLGPEGTGALYIKPERLAQLAPPLVGWASAATFKVDFAGGGNQPWQDLLHPDARRFEVATPPVVAVAGVKAAIEFLEGLGLDRVSARVRHLAGVCRRRLAEIPGVTVWGAGQPEAFSGLVTFSIERDGGDGVGPEAVVEQLFREHRIVCRSIAHPQGVRLSLHAFNTEEEIEQVARALEALLG